MAEKKSIFISMGRPTTDEHTKFRDALVEFVKQCGLEPRVINVTDYPTGNPLKGIAEVLRQSSGAIVVAAERTYFENGTERRASTNPVRLQETRFTTPWSQIETAMAYTLGLPILIVSEPGLREEGLLEEKYDWYVERVALNDKMLENSALRGRLVAWCRSIEKDQKASLSKISKLADDMTVKDLFKLISIKTAVQLAALVGLIFAAGSSFGRWIKG